MISSYDYLNKKQSFMNMNESKKKFYQTVIQTWRIGLQMFAEEDTK